MPTFKDMNYLAHLYLSGNDADLLLGNFIADHLKGEDRKRLYPEAIKRGIALHRRIDAFTDGHPVVTESKMRVRSSFGKYAPVIVDVFYDHFLAANWERYHAMPLPIYAQQTYDLLQSRFEELPSGAQHMLPFMRQHDWLSGYAHMTGIQRVMGGMSRRSKFESRMHEAPTLLALQYAAFEAEFNRFFPELEAHVAQFEG
jgi:acyl carrier protein phosphodiesterase